MNSLSEVFCQQGFEVNRRAPVPGTGLKADLYAKHRSQFFLGLRYEDYFFIYDADRQYIQDKESLLSKHEIARSFVNSLYRTPKALRLTIPIIATVAITSESFSSEMIEHVRQISLATFLGGEANVLVLVNLQQQEVILRTPVGRSPGAIPVRRANETILGMCNLVFLWMSHSSKSPYHVGSD